MTTKPDLIPYRHWSHNGNLYVKKPDITKAAHQLWKLIRIAEDTPENSGETARNIVLGGVNKRNQAHLLFLGGVAIAPDLRTVFWSSPHSEHAHMVETDKQFSVLIGHTHKNRASLRMEAMSAKRVTPKDVPDYLEDLNRSRIHHNMDPWEPQHFQDASTPRGLYVLTPPQDQDMITTPLTAYVREGNNLIQPRSVAYPISASQIFDSHRLGQ